MGLETMLLSGLALSKLCDRDKSLGLSEPRLPVCEMGIMFVPTTQVSKDSLRYAMQRKHFPALPKP